MDKNSATAMIVKDILRFMLPIFSSVLVSFIVQIFWLNVHNQTASELFEQISPILNVVRNLILFPSQNIANPLLEGRSHSRVRYGYFADPLLIEPWSDAGGHAIELEKPSGHSRNEFMRKEPSHSETEAAAALRAAVTNRAGGNLERAKTLIRHAVALAPNHPDVLTEYGIIVETMTADVIKAEGFYSRALHWNPYHSEALIRRAQALPLVERIDNEMLKNLRLKRDFFVHISPTNAALRRAMRESYFAHVYHTLAIEGNSMTLMQTRSVLESRMVVAGKSIIEHNEILGMDAALRFLNKTLVHSPKIILQDILSIHKRILSYVDPDWAGVYRNTKVFVGNFAPISPVFIAEEMDELVRWLNDEETRGLDPVELAAIAHYKLVYIHPFIDGNGRTARLLMNLILMQHGFPPVIVHVEDRAEYYQTLIAANLGNLRPFIRFIARQADTTLQFYINAVSTCYATSFTDCAVTLDALETQQSA